MERQPMYLQRIVCTGMHVLCCLGTQGSSTPPDESALTVHLSSEYKVKFLDKKKNVVAEKAYRFDTCFQWEREVYGRAVEMLGGQQSCIDAEKMKAILRAMADLSTETERAHVHSTGGAVKIQWNRDKFAGAVKMLGGQQSKVDAEEVEEILHAMAYQSTGKFDVLRVSNYMNNIANRNGEIYEIPWDTVIFDKTYNIMVGKEQVKVKGEDMVEILHLMDYLCVRKEWEGACYEKLARKTMKEYKKAAAGYTKPLAKKAVKLWRFLFSHMQNLQGLYVEVKRKEEQKKAPAAYNEMFVKKVAKEDTRPQSFLLYTQHLLRPFLEEHGMRLTVDEKRKTLDLRCTHSKKEQREKRTGDWVLRVEVSEKYRRQTEVQEVAEMLVEVMDMVEVDLEGWKPEDKVMLERIISKGKKTDLRIKCGGVEPGVISQHIEMLKNNVVELGVSFSRNLSNYDWETVGKMTKLEWLYISDCDIEARTIAWYMHNLNLVELGVSFNTNLSDEDWDTIGRMTRLKRLNIGYCNIQAGMIAKHMQNLNLVELNVSHNKNLSDKDWKTVGEMTNLKKLNISGCDVQKEQFSRYLGGLRCHIEK
eukprot:jgi/Antlo1/170/778